MGDVAITSASEDDPILEDSKIFDGNFDHLNFEQGSGRRNNKSEMPLYGETHIAKYKDKLFEFYEQGRKESSKKMNPAMMREQLKKDYPNVFSLPGETEIKKYTSLLFSQTKDGKLRDKESEEVDNSNTMIDKDVTNCEDNEWRDVLENRVMVYQTKKPAFIYEQFIKQMVEERGINQNDLPSKKHIKGRISSTKSAIKKKLQRSIV